jgi:Ca-activated chloride channel family protein
MRFLLTLGLISLTAVLAAADKDEKTDLQQPMVNITPRATGRRPEPEMALDHKPNIRVDTTLVLIPVAVTDLLSRFVTGLDKENFRLYEDKVEQQIIQFSSEDTPISVGVVFDTSRSMGAKLSRSRQAVSQFLKTANPEDEFFLIEFSDRPELVVEFSSNPEEIQNRLAFTQAKGSTALLDGLYMAMNKMKKARNPRKAILIISDGGDNSSRYTQGEVKNAVRESDVQVYAIGIY